MQPPISSQEDRNLRKVLSLGLHFLGKTDNVGVINSSISDDEDAC